MKTAIASLAALLLAPALLTAQNDVGVRFGLKLSPNTSWIKPDTRGLKRDGNALGYTFGLMADFPIGSTGNYYFASGLFLNRIGGAWVQNLPYQEGPNDEQRNKPLETKIRLSYIELPLTIKMMTNEIGYMRYYGQVGIGAAFNIRAKGDVMQPVYHTDGIYVREFRTIEDEDLMETTNFFKAALIVGAGLEYNFSGNTALMAGVQYNGGFTNLLTDVEVTVDDSKRKGKAMANYIELSLGVFF